MSIVKQNLKIKDSNFKNRLVLPPMATNKATDEGIVTEEIVRYYDEKTAGGYFSLVILEHAHVEEAGRCTSNQLSIGDDDKIEGLSKIADIIHKNGSYAVIQLNYAGAKGICKETNKAPSRVDFTLDTLCKVKYWTAYQEFTKVEIKNIVQKFTDAALRAKKAGFDGIELHSAHGFLLNQFYSPYTNKRTDEYGGTVENRLRIHREIIKSVREVVGEEFLILVRLGAVDYIDNGSDKKDAVKAAEILEKSGVDIIDISGGLCGYTIKGITSAGYFGDITSEIKNHVSVPVILTGGVEHIQQAEELLKENKADLIGVGRAVLKDSAWAEKEFNKIS